MIVDSLIAFLNDYAILFSVPNKHCSKDQHVSPSLNDYQCLNWQPISNLCQKNISMSFVWRRTPTRSPSLRFSYWLEAGREQSFILSAFRQTILGVLSIAS